MQMVKRVRDEIRDMRRRASLDGEPYVSSKLPIKLTQEQWDAFMVDPYLATLHSPEGMDLIYTSKQYLGHPIEIVEE
jgi:hypothetical protein